MHDTDYDAMSAEELEARLRELFFYPDEIDGPVYRELEAMRAALERKRPLPEAFSPEEAWERFLEDNREELEALWRTEASVPARDTPRRRGLRTLLRGALAAAVLLALLAGAALAAGPRLWTWVSGWSAPLEPQATGSPIQQALAARGITEPLYPSWLPTGYTLTEAHISEDPLLLYELYTRENHYITITITPVTAVEKARYPQEDQSAEEYRAGEAAHYIYSNGGYVTAVWYTDNYFVSINGNILSRAIKRIVDSVYTT